MVSPSSMIQEPSLMTNEPSRHEGNGLLSMIDCRKLKYLHHDGLTTPLCGGNSVMKRALPSFREWSYIMGGRILHIGGASLFQVGWFFNYGRKILPSMSEWSSLHHETKLKGAKAHFRSGNGSDQGRRLTPDRNSIGAHASRNARAQREELLERGWVGLWSSVVERVARAP